MRTWTDQPFLPAVPLSAVPEGRLIATGKGESTKVYEIAGQPQWLAKIYRRHLSPPEERRLARLIAMPATMAPADVEWVDRTMGWPVARIVEFGRTVGVVMAKAPEHFHAALQGLRPVPEPARPLEIDWLVSAPDKIARRGLRPPDAAARTRAMWDFLHVGALFERYNIVYADWSYSNALWAHRSGEIFVIDMDTCGFGSRPWIESPGCEDPLFTDRNQPLTTLSDRYKVAVLALRCLTAVRGDPVDAFRTLSVDVRKGTFGTLMKRMLTVSVPADRPTIGELLTAFELVLAAHQPGNDNVTGSVPLGDRHSGGRPGRSTAGAPAPPPVRRSRGRFGGRTPWRLRHWGNGIAKLVRRRRDRGDALPALPPHASLEPKLEGASHD